MYVCRALSYKAAELEVVEVPLEANMIVLCNSASSVILKLLVKIKILHVNVATTMVIPMPLLLNIKSKLSHSVTLK